MPKPRSVSLYCAAALLFACGGAAQTQPARPPLAPYVAENKLFALYKPANWTVREESRHDMLRVLVQSPASASRVDLFWARNEQGRADAAQFVRLFRQYLSQSHPDIAFSEIFVSRDGVRAVATVRYSANGARVRGRYYFESKPGGLSAQGYSAPEAVFEAQRPLLLNVMASFAFGRPGAAPPQPVQVRLVQRRAQDGSLTISLPENWNLLAAGGKMIASGPEGAGFIFTSIAGNPMLRQSAIERGVIASRYQPPAQTLATILQAFGHRNVRILSSTPDHASNQQFAMQIRGRADTQDITAQWTLREGGECTGAMKVLNSLPSMTGQWYCILAGVWAPSADYPRYLPMLEQVAASFSINDQYARRYIQAGLENLRRLQAQTANAIRGLNNAREQNQRDWEAGQARKDYMDSKWDDYRRGNSYWVSDMEGGKVYHTDPWGTRDTTTGDYYEGRGYNWTNFEGQNPRHPSESMREISSYEVNHPGPPPR